METGPLGAFGVRIASWYSETEDDGIASPATIYVADEEGHWHRVPGLEVGSRGDVVRWTGGLAVGTDRVVVALESRPATAHDDEGHAELVLLVGVRVPPPDGPR